MKLKTILAVFVAFIFLASTFGGALANVEAETNSEIIDSRTYEGEEITSSTGDFTGDKVSFLNLLFGGNLLGFTNILAEDVNQCGRTASYDNLIQVYDGGVNQNGVRLYTTFPTCEAGEYIIMSHCSEGGVQSCSTTFAEMWYKEDSNDKLYFDQYWTVDLGDFQYTYDCYQCDFSPVLSTFTCWADEWRGEPGTPSEDLSGTCTYGCSQTTTDLDTVIVNEIEDELCNDFREEVDEGDDGAGNEEQTQENEDREEEQEEEEEGVTALSGEFTRVLFPEEIQIGQTYTVEASFRADVEGVYYIESGADQEPQPLALIQAEGSKCDQDIHYAGEWLSFDAGETAEIEFTLVAREESGLYGILVGAYTGCLTEGGSEITKETSFIDFVEEEVTTPFYTDVVDVEGTQQATGLGYSATDYYFYGGLGLVAVGTIVSFAGFPMIGLPLIIIGGILSFLGL